MEKVEQLRLLKSLEENKGFLLLGEYLQPRMDGLQSEILNTPCSTLDSCLQQEYKKGELQGIVSLEGIRQTTIEALESDIVREKEQNGSEIEPEQEDGTERGGDHEPSNAP